MKKFYQIVFIFILSFFISVSSSAQAGFLQRFDLDSLLGQATGVATQIGGTIGGQIINPRTGRFDPELVGFGGVIINHPVLGEINIFGDGFDNIAVNIGLFGAYSGDPNILKCQGRIDFQTADCSATALNQIAAAWASEGYWAQYGILSRLATSQFGAIASLIYVVAAISAIIMFAFGSPPKMYLWYFMGPAIYAFLLFTPAYRKGVRWQIAGVPGDMREVWKLAEVGIRNAAVKHFSLASALRAAGVNDGGLLKYVTLPEITFDPSAFGTFYDVETGPNAFARVSWFFSMYDSFVSGVVDRLVRWTGIFTQVGAAGPSSNLMKSPVDAYNNSWFLLSNSKWPLLQDITSAKLTNLNFREMIADFFANECGEVLKNNLNETNFINAANQVKKTNVNLITGVLEKGTYKELQHTIIPFPKMIRDMIIFDKTNVAGASTVLSFNPANSSFKNFSTEIDKNYKIVRDNEDGEELLPDFLSCSDYLTYIVSGIRFESGHIFKRILAPRSGSNSAVPEPIILYDFLYGWKLLDGEGEKLEEFETQQDFLTSLITFYMMKNEFQFTIPLMMRQENASETVIRQADISLRTSGSVQKFGEFYTWAKMMPYVQGVLLYILAFAFPFASIAILNPNWIKVLFTWMSFFAWAKSWDVGFAIVASMERSIWATIGSNADSVTINQRVLEGGQQFGIKVDCNQAVAAPGGGPGGLLGTIVDYAQQIGEYLALIGLGIGGSGSAGLATDVPNLSCAIPEITSDIANADGTTFSSLAYNLFNQGLAMKDVLNHDINNAYYIYLMSALYFAVPVVSGQVLLGAKAGAASIATQGISGTASEAGQGAKSGYVGDYTEKGKSNKGVAEQSTFAKNLRKGGKNSLAAKGIAAGNKALQHDLAGALAGEAESNIGRVTSGYQAMSDLSSRGTGLDKAKDAKAHDYMTRLMMDNLFGGVSEEARRLEAIEGLLENSLGQGGGSGLSGSTHTPGSSGPNPPVPPGTPSVNNVIPETPGQKFVRGLVDKLPGTKSTMAANWSAQARHFDQMQASNDYNMSKFANQQAHIGRLKSNQYSASRGALGMKSRAESANAQKYSQAAQQQAKEGSWRDMNAFGMAVGGDATAVGVFAGTFSAGPKPESIDGMAALGMLNTYGEGGEPESNLSGGGEEGFWFTDAQNGSFQGDASRGFRAQRNQNAADIQRSFDVNADHAYLGSSLTDEQMTSGKFASDALQNKESHDGKANEAYSKDISNSNQRAMILAGNNTIFAAKSVPHISKNLAKESGRRTLAAAGVISVIDSYNGQPPETLAGQMQSSLGTTDPGKLAIAGLASAQVALKVGEHLPGYSHVQELGGKLGGKLGEEIKESKLGQAVSDGLNRVGEEKVSK